MADRSAAPNTMSTIAAWAVHLFTATSAVFALLALVAVIDEQWRAALLWLFAALIVDGVDGTLARAAHVKTYAPRIDGEALDLVVDYLTYVFVPAIFMWRGGWLPESLTLPLVALILLSSLYVFARKDMKTDDGYFRGFPALWNIVALYFFVGSPTPAIAAATVVVLSALTFAPVHAVHPFRVRDYGWSLLALSAIWAASTAALLLPGLGGATAHALIAVSLASAAILLAMGLLRSVRGPRPNSP